MKLAYKNSNVWLYEFHEELNELNLLESLIGEIPVDTPDYLKFAYVYKYGQSVVENLLSFDSEMSQYAFEELYNELNTDIKTNLLSRKPNIEKNYLNQCEHNYFVYQIMNFFYDSATSVNHTPDISNIGFINVFEKKNSSIPKYCFRYLDFNCSLTNAKYSDNKYLKECISLFETYKHCQDGLQDSLENFYIDFNKVCEKFEAENKYSAYNLILDFCKILFNKDSWEDIRTEFISVLDEYYANIGTKSTSTSTNATTYSMFNDDLQYIISELCDRAIEVYINDLSYQEIKALNTFVSNTENYTKTNMIASKLLEFGVIKFNDLIEVIEILEYLYKPFTE